MTISSWNLSTCFYTMANHPLQSQKRHYNGLQAVSCVIPTVIVLCGDISDVCYVLSVTVCPLILSLYTDKKC